MTRTTDAPSFSPLACGAGDDPLEDRLRANVRATIEAVFEEELAAFPGRLRHGRGEGARKGWRHGHRERQLTGTFGTETVRVPRARVADEAGRVRDWRSLALPRHQRLTRKAEARIAAVYLAGTDTRRVERALVGLFDGAVGKDVVSRAWRKVEVDWDAWVARSLADEDVVRLVSDGTVIRTRLDRKAADISVPAAIHCPAGHCRRQCPGRGRAPGRAEGAAFHPRHGRGKHGCVAPFGWLARPHLRPRTTLTSTISTPEARRDPRS